MKFSFDYGNEGEDENKVLIAPLRQNQLSGYRTHKTLCAWFTVAAQRLNLTGLP